MDPRLEGREFKVWEYGVSHGSLLIRSPALGEFSTNLDIIFKGVIYLRGPTNLGKIKIYDADTDAIPSSVASRIRAPGVWRLATDEQDLVVAAAFMNVEENKRDVFASFF